MCSHYAFPSDPKQSLASVIFQKLPQMGIPGDPLSLLVEFGDLLIEMWHQCLSERYYGPIYHLAALLSYTLHLNTVAVAPQIISSLIPVCATTCRLVAVPRLHSADGDLSEHPDAVVRQLCQNIDVTHCLSLLYLAALGCLPPAFHDADGDPPQPSPQLEFWKVMEFDFVLMMLSPKHPETDWLTMMSLLRTSASPDSIGPIPFAATNPPTGRGELRSPEAVAATIIDCVSSFLCEPPRWATPGSEKELLAKSAALGTLIVFASSPFGALQIAESDVAIPRLVTVLCWAIDRLYDSDLPPTQPATDKSRKEPSEASQTVNGDEMDLDQGDPNIVDGVEDDAAAVAEVDLTDAELYPMAALCRIVSHATWLLHFLVTDPQTADVANTSTKLAASYGGSQRYFLALARLNFAEEDLVLEAGIDAETVELAHELLELAVTPDEGEEIGEMFD
jgi:hypothetical protein